MKKQVFFLKALTGHRNYLVIGSQKIIGDPIIFLHVMVFCLTMKAQGEVKLSLQEKLPEQWQKYC